MISVPVNFTVDYKSISKRRNLLSLQILKFFVIALLPYLCRGSSWNEPHYHEGKVTPFTAGNPRIELDSKALAILNSGYPYKSHIQSGTSFRSLIIKDINAPTAIVWEKILDFNNYENMEAYTYKSKIYSVEKHRGGSQTIFTRMKVGLPLLKFDLFLKHTYTPKLNSLTWTLDYSKRSDFDDSCGFWYVLPHPDHPKNMTRVYYSVEVSMFSWIPKFAVDFMSTKALTDATSWVSKYSEMEFTKVKSKEENASIGSSSSSWLGRIFLGRQASMKESTGGKDKEETRTLKISANHTDAVREEECNSEECLIEDNDLLSIDIKPRQEVGIIRLFLLTSVFGLVLFNIHLYFSQ